MKLPIHSACTASLALVLVTAADPAPPVLIPPPPEFPRRVALTFDDLPMTGNAICDGALAREVTAKLTGVLATRSLPAAGLVTPGRECISAELLRETLAPWRQIGAVIGNHTATHPDLNTTSVSDYVADIERAQVRIDAAVDAPGRWFRPPYLHTGDEPRKKAALADYLAKNGYRLAPVTIDNQEWVYAAVYANARRRGAAGLAERLESVVEMLERRGYNFISLPEAVSDPAYARPDTYVGTRGLSWIQRWALEEGVPVPDEPREAAWVADEFRSRH